MPEENDKSVENVTQTARVARPDVDDYIFKKEPERAVSDR